MYACTHTYRWKGVDKTLATKRVNVLKINADELRWMTGEKDLDVAAVLVRCAPHTQTYADVCWRMLTYADVR